MNGFSHTKNTTKNVHAVVHTHCNMLNATSYIHRCTYTCARGFLSRRGCLYIYTIVCILVQLIHVHLHVHNSIFLLSPFLRLSLLSLFPFLSLMLVCYIYTYFPYIVGNRRGPDLPQQLYVLLATCPQHNNCSSLLLPATNILHCVCGLLNSSKTLTRIT